VSGVQPVYRAGRRISPAGQPMPCINGRSAIPRPGEAHLAGPAKSKLIVPIGILGNRIAGMAGGFD
jgi:hypothetical protein